MKMRNTENKDQNWYETRTALLREFMTEERFATLYNTLSMRTRYMTVLAENMFHGQNAAALIRHCEAFGVQDMHTVESVCSFEPSAAVMRGTDQWVNVNRHETTHEALMLLKQQGYRIVATTPHRNDSTPETFDVTKGKFALVFGTEHAGISDEVIAAADEFLMIPMCGMVESLNVSASAAILIYTLTRRIREQVPEWALTDADRAQTIFRWVYRSVKDSAEILNRTLGDELPTAK